MASISDRSTPPRYLELDYPRKVNKSATIVCLGAILIVRVVAVYHEIVIINKLSSKSNNRFSSSYRLAGITSRETTGLTPTIRNSSH